MTRRTCRLVTAVAAAGVLCAAVLSVRPAASAPQPQQPAPAAPAAQMPPDMTQYFMVFLRRGPAWTAAATPESIKVGQAHRANLDRLTKEGLLVVAGPFDGQRGERALAGILILRVASLAEATAIADGDPGVKAGRFVYDIAPWWGPTSLKH
jgi:uncharacterized protein YciI